MTPPDNETLYLQGYYKAHGQPELARQDLEKSDVPAAFKNGIRDALAGRPQMPPVAQTAMPPAAPPAAGNGGIYVEPPPPDPNATPAQPAGPVRVRRAPGYNPNLPPGPGQVLPRYNQFFEVLATVPLIGKLPYDEAIDIQQLPGRGLLLDVFRSFVRFEVLGADPQDWIDGYRLSGPTGLLAARVAGLIRQGILSSPGSLGLPAWYGAKTTRGIRLLGLAELEALGISPPLGSQDNPALRQRGGNL